MEQLYQAFNPNVLAKLLKDVFTRKQLAFMEIAFQGCSNFAELSRKDREEAETLCFSHYNDELKVKLTRLCNYIIDHKGEFANETSSKG